MIKSQYKILLVDDNLADINLLQEVLGEQDLDLEIVALYDGLAAVKYLLREDPHKGAPNVDLVILDLNLPIKKGAEVLEEIRDGGVITPVIIYTTSDNPSDIKKMYEKAANCYIVKPTCTKELFTLMDTLIEFWFRRSERPEEHYQ